MAYLPLLASDGSYRRLPGRQVVIRDPSGGIAFVAGVFSATVDATGFVPSLYPVDGERGDGDMVTG